MEIWGNILLLYNDSGEITYFHGPGRDWLSPCPPGGPEQAGGICRNTGAKGLQRA